MEVNEGSKSRFSSRLKSKGLEENDGAGTVHPKSKTREACFQQKLFFMTSFLSLRF